MEFIVGLRAGRGLWDMFCLELQHNCSRCEMTGSKLDPSQVTIMLRSAQTHPGSRLSSFSPALQPLTGPPHAAFAMFCSVGCAGPQRRPSLRQSSTVNSLQWKCSPAVKVFATWASGLQCCSHENLMSPQKYVALKQTKRKARLVHLSAPFGFDWMCLRPTR